MGLLCGLVHLGRLNLVYSKPIAPVRNFEQFREERYSQYAQRKTSARPSEFCMQDHRMPDIKSRKFLKSYWSTETLVTAAMDYRKLTRLKPNELCLADIIRG